MANLKQIKGKIRSVERTNKVTKAMEAVSAVKMRRTQAQALAGRPYAAAAMRALSRVAGSAEGLDHPLTRRRPLKRLCLTVVTSDKGLAGSVNSAVLREAHAAIRRAALPKERVEIIAIGRKAAEHFEKRDYRLIERMENNRDDISVAEVRHVTSMLTEGYRAERFDACAVIYQHFVSTFEQRPSARAILPLALDELAHILAGIRGGAESGTDGAAELRPVASYTVEPDAEAVLAELLPELVNIFVYHTLIEAKASEHSARMVAMKNASDKSDEMRRALTREYNKIRQAVITREVSEIVGGIEA